MIKIKIDQKKLTVLISLPELYRRFNLFSFNSQFLHLQVCFCFINFLLHHIFVILYLPEKNNPFLCASFYAYFNFHVFVLLFFKEFLLVIFSTTLPASLKMFKLSH